jgi:hypothetical protein
MFPRLSEHQERNHRAKKNQDEQNQGVLATVEQMQ